MAVYRIYPSKDTFISSTPSVASLYPNAGLDEIVELGGYPDINNIGRTRRILTQYTNADITYALGTLISTAYSASIHYTIAEASEVPTDFTVYSYPVSQSWDNGTGKIDDIPMVLDGVSWKYKDDANTAWNQTGSDYVSASIYTSTQSFGLGDDLDLNIDVTRTIDAIYSGSLNNYGHLIRLENAYENYTSSSISLKYFSKDTHTIFPPYLEFKWDDSVYSSSLSVLSSDESRIHIKNLKEAYHDSDVAKIRIDAKPRYPVRTFTTSSINSTNYKLPSGSTYAIKEDFSEKMIIDFDSFSTKISADNTSSYLNLYMKILQPERYYQLLVKTTIDGNTLVYKSSTFKVVRNA